MLLTGRPHLGVKFLQEYVTIDTLNRPRHSGTPLWCCCTSLSTPTLCFSHSFSSCCSHSHLHQKKKSHFRLLACFKKKSPRFTQFACHCPQKCQKWCDYCSQWHSTPLLCHSVRRIKPERRPDNFSFLSKDCWKHDLSICRDPGWVRCVHAEVSGFQRPQFVGYVTVS